MAYFFANQGSSFEFLRDQGYMYTTYVDRDGHPSPNVPPLQNMIAGDTVIINLSGLVGVARVISNEPDFAMTREFAEATSKYENKESNWAPGMLGLRVNVVYEAFDRPIRYQEFSNEILSAQAQSTGLRQPFDNNGNANQGTFYWLDMPLARVLMKIVGRPIPEVQAITAPKSSTSPDAVSYVAKFASREIRPEQSTFRKLMLDLWKKCPVTGIKNPELLDAAHLLDWRHHNGEDAGMLLNPLIHRAVDREIIEIELDPSGKWWRVRVLVREDPYFNQFDLKMFENPLAL